MSAAEQRTGETRASAAPDANALKALTAATIGYAMDGFDLLILGFLLRSLAGELHLGPAEAGSLVTVTLFGAVIGGIVFGVLSDYYGRVKVLTWTILLFGIATGLCALAQGYWDLLAYRTIAGLGLGGEFGIGMALAAEAWPPSKRARVSSYVGLGWQAGVLAAALVTPILLPVIGWRGMFAVGVVPALVSLVVRYAVGEPELFTCKKRERPGKIPIALLLKDKATARISLGMLILCSVQNFGYFGLMIWLPSYLSGTMGYNLTRTALWTAMTVLGMAFGIWLFGELADRVGRRPIFYVFQAGAAIMVVVYAQLTSPFALLIGGAVMGIFVNGMLGGYGALMSELYPTAARATAQNVLFNLGRAVGGIGPWAIGAIAVSYSFTAAISLLAILYVLDILATALLIPERKGAPLE
ncbi:MAG: transporter [Rhodospirillales bacterium]|nr:transporter [Rhodospirillales bacterium]